MLTTAEKVVRAKQILLDNYKSESDTDLSPVLTEATIELALTSASAESSSPLDPDAASEDDGDQSAPNAWLAKLGLGVMGVMLAMH